MNANGLALVPCRERGWKMGLVNMLSKENHGWWRTRRWWIPQATLIAEAAAGIAESFERVRYGECTLDDQGIKSVEHRLETLERAWQPTSA